MAFQIKGEDKITYDNLNNNVTTLMQPKNWIINGGFDVWQRGTSQTSSGYGSDDRWQNINVGSTKTHSRQAFTVGQTEVPNNPTYFIRTVVSSVAGAGNYVVKWQKIEDVTKLAGKTVSLSFWAKADASKNMSISFTQDFGVGGSLQINELGVQKFSLTTSWQRFTKTITLPSISGKTIGPNNLTVLYFFFDAGSNLNSYTDSLGNQSGTFDIANVSLVEGSVPVEWQTEAYADVLRQCQRYYYRINASYIYTQFAQGAAYSTTDGRFQVHLKAKLRVLPTSLEYASLTMTTPSAFATFSSLILDDVVGNNDSPVIRFIGTGYTFDKQYFLNANNTTNAYIAFSAEL